MNTDENIAYNIIHNNSYIYSQTVKGGTKELKDYVLSDEGYSISSDGFKINPELSLQKFG